MLYWHRATSDFEASCGLLWRFGAALAYDPDQGLIPYVEGEWYASFQFVDVPKLDEALLTSGNLAELFQAYLGLACDWSKVVLPTHRGAFIPDCSFQPEVDALLRCGYLQLEQELYSWTDKAASAMQAADFWDKDNLSREAKREEMFQARLEELWALTPLFQRKQLLRDAKSHRGADWIVCLKERYNDLYFSTLPDGRVIPKIERDIRFVFEVRKKIFDCSRATKPNS